MLPDESDFLLNRNSHVIIVGPTTTTHAFKHTRTGYELKLRVLYTGSEYRISRCLSNAQEYNLKITVLGFLFCRSGILTNAQILQHESRDR
jgi:hypothetical protein